MIDYNQEVVNKMHKNEFSRSKSKSRVKERKEYREQVKNLVKELEEL